MADILVNFQAIKDTELETNTNVNNQGVITFTETKILLGLGTNKVDYVDNIQNIINNAINNIQIENKPIYNGTKTTDEIAADLTNLSNSFVFNTTTNSLVYIPKDATEIANVIEIPITGITITYAEKYVAGQNIQIVDRDDGMKEISAISNNFTGFQVYSDMPTYKDLFTETNNLVYFVF